MQQTQVDRSTSSVAGFFFDEIFEKFADERYFALAIQADSCDNAAAYTLPGQPATTRGVVHNFQGIFGMEVVTFEKNFPGV